MPTTAVEAPAKPIILVAAVALIDADGRVLLAQRPDGKGREAAGSWSARGEEEQDEADAIEHEANIYAILVEFSL